jgi:ornithine cyclodeaminase/alanine dehydrogenase
MRIIKDIDIQKLGIKDLEIFQWIKEAFILKNTCNLPPKISQKFNNKTNFYNTMPVIIPDIDTAGLKLVTRYIDRKPSIQGDILLYSYLDGELLSLMDATWITAKRTGAVAALAVDLLAKENFESIAIMGLGETAKAFLDMFLLKETNKFKKFKLLKYKNQTDKIVKYLNDKNIHDIDICNSEKELFDNSDVIISAITVAKGELGKDSWFKEGVLLVPIHTQGFKNCDLFFDKVFADDTSHVKEFEYFNKFKSFAEIDKVVKSEIQGRTTDRERILSYNIGIALHDLYIAKMIYDKVINND